MIVAVVAADASNASPALGDIAMSVHRRVVRAPAQAACRIVGRGRP